jgi:hypothetical protein
MHKHEIKLQPLEIRGAQGECRLPEAGEASLPLPRGFGRSPHGACHRRRCARRCPRGARWRLCDTRSLLFSSLGGGRLLLCHLCGSWRQGRRTPPLGGTRPPSLPFSPSSSDDEFSGVAGGESPYCSRSRYSSSYCSRRSRRRILLSFLRTAFSFSHRCEARAVAWEWGVGGSDCEASTVTL